MTLIHKECHGELVFSGLYLTEDDPHDKKYGATYYGVKCERDEIAPIEMTSVEYA